MKHFRIEYSEQARTDIRGLFNVIVYKYKAPNTAFKYVQGMFDEINKLSHSPETFVKTTQPILAAIRTSTSSA